MIELCKNTQTSHTLKFKQCEVLFKLRLMNKFTCSVCSEKFCFVFNISPVIFGQCVQLKNFLSTQNFKIQKRLLLKNLKWFSIDFWNYYTLEYTGLHHHHWRRVADPVMNMNSFMMQSIGHNSRCCTLWCFCFNNIISIPKTLFRFHSILKIFQKLSHSRTPSLVPIHPLNDGHNKMYKTIKFLSCNRKHGGEREKNLTTYLHLHQKLKSFESMWMHTLDDR